MQVTNCGRGIHKNEVEGVDQFKKNLPADWFAFTNLDLAFGPGMAREIDVKPRKSCSTSRTIYMRR